MTIQNKSLLDLATFTRGSCAIRTNKNGSPEVIAAQVPRIDYDPVTREPKGFLCESYAVNMFTNGDIEGVVGSAPKSMSIATVNKIEVSTDKFKGPNGKSAKHIMLGADTNVGYMWFTPKPSTVYTASVEVFIPTGNTHAELLLSPESTTAKREYQTYTSMTKASSRGVFQTVSTTFKTTADCTGTLALVFRFTTSWNTDPAWFNQFFYSDCWMVVEGEIKGSFIPTLDTATARAVDSLIIQGKNFTDIWNPKEGTFIAEFDINALGLKNWPGVFSVDLDWQNCLHVYVDDYNTDRLLFEIYNAASGLTTGPQAWGFISDAAVLPNKKYKFSISYSNAGVTVGFGGKVTKTPLATGVLNFASFTKMKIGQSRGGLPLGGHISKFNYIPRELNAAEHLLAIKN